MTNIVEQSEKSREDLYDIWFYIAVKKASGLNADRFLDKLQLEFIKLAKTPGMGTSREDKAEGLRFWPFGNYNIYYLAIENGVRIVRVLHAKRDSDKQSFQ